MKRIRVAAVVVAVVGLLGVVPAQARTGAQIDFSATIAFPQSGYPVVSAPTYGSFSLLATFCVASEVNVLKAKAPAAAGTCGLSASGTWGPDMTGNGGHCRLAGGDIQGTYTGPGGQTVAFSGHYEIHDDDFRFLGTATKTSTGQTGPMTLHGAIDWDPACVMSFGNHAAVHGLGDFSIS